MPFKILLAAAMLFATANSWAINRCKTPNGFVYQDLPCAGEHESTKVNTSGAGKAETSDSAPGGYWKRESERQKQQEQDDAQARAQAEKLQSAIENKRVFRGMTADQVIRSWGKPDKINSTITSSGKSEQWIYERGSIGNTQYLYMDNGILSSMQSPK